MNSLSLILVIPCFNEASRLDRNAFLDFLRDRPDNALLFVDDGSRDETARMVDEWGKSHPRIYLVRRPENGGKASAVRQGIAVARSLLGPFRTGAYVGYWDADLATPLKEVDDFRAELESNLNCQAVFGARVKMVGRTIQRKALRHYLGRAFASMVGVLLNLPFYDTQCGAKLFRHGPGLAFAFDLPFRSRWVFDVEVALRLRRWALSVGQSLETVALEHPLKVWEHRSGSKLRVIDSLRAVADVFSLCFQHGPGKKRKP